MMSASAPAARSSPVRLTADITGAPIVVSGFSRTDITIDTVMATQTASAIGPDQIRIAGGAEADIHGSAISTRSHSGASDAPARHASQTSAAAARTISKDVAETGKTATRASPVPVNASEAWDSQAASAVAMIAA